MPKFLKRVADVAVLAVVAADYSPAASCLAVVAVARILAAHLLQYVNQLQYVSQFANLSQLADAANPRRSDVAVADFSLA